MKRHSLLIIVLSILLIVVVVINLHLRANNNNVTQAVERIPQNAFVYLNPATENQSLISAEEQQQLVKDYLIRYFSPWVTPAIFNEDIKKAESYYVNQFTKYPGWGINRHRHNRDWMIAITNNMNLSVFPNHLHKAITLSNADLRVLPTDDPSFGDLAEAGEGYPFDYAQESLVAANTPVLILQTTQDGAWDLILTNSDLGWIKVQNIANVDNKFIQKWQTGNYAVIIKDRVSVFDDKHLFRFKANIGWVFPFEKQKILIAIADENQNALIRTAEIDPQQLTLLPLSLTPKNIATIVNNLLGVQYGWGDLLGYRDCSSTMMNLFAPFGIWLPRNSADQAHMGNFIDLKNLSAEQKTKKIISEGIPFLTLLHLPGHIVLYIGQHDGQAYILHNFWGLHTQNFWGRKGRAVVGETAITSLDLGKGYINVPKRYIDLVQSMAVLGGKVN